jgi:hypothetical protein
VRPSGRVRGAGAFDALTRTAAGDISRRELVRNALQVWATSLALPAASLAGDTPPRDATRAPRRARGGRRKGNDVRGTCKYFMEEIRRGVICADGTTRENAAGCTAPFETARWEWSPPSAPERIGPHRWCATTIVHATWTTAPQIRRMRWTPVPGACCDRECRLALKLWRDELLAHERLHVVAQEDWPNAANRWWDGRPVTVCRRRPAHLRLVNWKQITRSRLRRYADKSLEELNLKIDKENPFFFDPDLCKTCKPPQTKAHKCCPGFGCVNTASDSQHCGGCEIACQCPNGGCSNGRCVACPPKVACCGGPDTGTMCCSSKAAPGCSKVTGRCCGACGKGVPEGTPCCPDTSKRCKPKTGVCE